MPHETDREMAERHVREAENHVARQSEVVEQLRIDGHDTKLAEELLVQFEAVLAEHKQHLTLVRAKQKSAGGP